MPSEGGAGGAAALLTAAALVTGNRNKLIEARRMCGFELEGVEVELPEIQSLDLIEVLEAKGREAYRRLGRPLVVEESGLELAALNRFPGPLVKWMLEAVGAEGIARVAAAQGSSRATARCALLYLDGDRSVVAEGVTPGRLVVPARGCGGFGWDPVFVPSGGTATFAELDGEAKDRVSHRGRAWRRLVELLT